MLKLLLVLTVSLLLERASVAEEEISDSETFILSGGPKSFLFSECLAAASSVEGRLYSVGEGEANDTYTKTYEDASKVTWEDEETADSFLHCYQMAADKEAIAFTHSASSGECKTTMTDGVLIANKPTCEGDVIYISGRAEAPTCNFMLEELAIGETRNDFCGVTCTEDGIIEDIASYGDGSNHFECCPTDTSPCFSIDGAAAQITTCPAHAECAYYGLRLIEINTPEKVAKAVEFLENNVADQSIEWFWVNIRYNSGQFVHVPSTEPVNVTLWANGNEPWADSTSCIAMNRQGKIDVRQCGVGSDRLCFICEEAEAELQPCP